MSKLTVKSGSQAGRELILTPGILQMGRNEANALFVPEPSISSRHCEFHVSEIGVAVHDLGSTNGTFINGQAISKGMLQNGDVLRTGEIEFAVELADVHIAIPEGALHTPEPIGAAFLEDGTPGCFSHRTTAALFRCTGCEQWWCGECVRQLKRLSGDFLNFCPECSGACALFALDQRRSRKSLFQRVSETLKMKK